MAFAQPTSSSIMSAPLQDPSQPLPLSSQEPNAKPQTVWEYMTNQRSRKQLAVFVLGAAFMTLSASVTRRSLAHRQRVSYPSFWRQSNAPPHQPVSGAIEAFEALQIATFNCVSSTVMLGGGLLWAFDISTVDELRRKIRGGLGVDGSGPGEKEAEEDFEEWLAKTLERRKQKDGRLQDESATVEDTGDVSQRRNDR